jgi:hypothetical protein
MIMMWMMITSRDSCCFTVHLTTASTKKFAHISIDKYQDLLLRLLDGLVRQRLSSNVITKPGTCQYWYEQIFSSRQ